MAERVGASLSVTVTVKEHFWPVEDITVMLCEPRRKKDPEAGVNVIVPQPAGALNAGKFTSVPSWPALAWTIILSGHVRTQSWQMPAREMQKAPVKMIKCLNDFMLCI